MIRDAIVIGGGAIGAASALELARRCVRCVLVDPDPRPTGASFGNAGHIATEQGEPLASPAILRSLPRRLFSRGGAVCLPPRDIGAWLPFALRLTAAARPRRFRAGRAALAPLLAEALPAWRRLLDLAGARALLREEGHFVVWESDGTAALGWAAWAAVDTGIASFRDATDAELAGLAALTRKRPAGAIRFAGTGQIGDLSALADALADALVAHGGERRTGRVVEVDPAAGAVRLADGTRLKAGAVLIAAGVHSAALLAPLGYRVPLIAERGYHIEAANASWPADIPPIVFEDRAMIVTGFRSGLRAASFVEFGRASSPPDARKWMRLRANVAELGLPFDGTVNEWMGARPTLPDYLPAIGRSDRAPRLFYAFGHHHLGLTLAAITAELVAALMTEDAAVIPLAPYRLERFR